MCIFTNQVQFWSIITVLAIIKFRLAQLMCPPDWTTAPAPFLASLTTLAAALTALCTDFCNLVGTCLILGIWLLIRQVRQVCVCSFQGLQTRKVRAGQRGASCLQNFNTFFCSVCGKKTKYQITDWALMFVCWTQNWGFDLALFISAAEPYPW